MKLTYVDSNEVSHRLLVRGPFVRCRDHAALPENQSLADVMASLSKWRTCARLRIAWQRHLLADEPKTTQIRNLPPHMLAYLDDQTARHAARLDEALGDGPPNDRARRRWHEMGWRSAPSLAAQYQAVGIEASVAYLAFRRGVQPQGIEAALKDPKSAVALALIETRRRGYTIHQLQLGQRALVTDDLPYEPLDAMAEKPDRVKVPDWREDLRAWFAADAPSVPVEEILARSGLRGDALRDATEWVVVVAAGFAREPDASFEVVVNGAIAGVDALRPRKRRRIAGSVARAR
jgi:hypothetical protein